MFCCRGKMTLEGQNISSSCTVTNGLGAPVDQENAMDAASAKGMFGWEQITDELLVPVIIRDVGRLVPVKIVEQELIRKKNTLPKQIFSCIHITSYPMTGLEANHINNINDFHCEFRYGVNPLAARDDSLVSVKDVRELNRFINISKKLYRRDIASNLDRLGIVRLKLASNYNNPLMVPYISKLIGQQYTRLVPVSVIHLHIKKPHPGSTLIPSNWDFTYLKMLCIYAHIDYSALFSPKDQLLRLDQLIDPLTGTVALYEDFIPYNINYANNT